MKKKKKTLKYYPDKRVIIDSSGTVYKSKKGVFKKIDNVEHTEHLIFEEIKLSEYEKNLDFVSSTLAKNITAERIIREIIKDYPTKKLNKMCKLLKEKNVKIKTHDGCVGLLIDAGKRKRQYIELKD